MARCSGIVVLLVLSLFTVSSHPSSAIAATSDVAGVTPPGADSRGTGVGDGSAAAESYGAGAARTAVGGEALLAGDRALPELPGWPAVMGITTNYAPGEGPATVDIDGDGIMEIFATSTDHRLYGWRVSGAALPGFPVTLNGMAQTSPAIGDVDGDGAPEILVATTASYAYAFRTDGTAVPGWPKHLSGSMLGFISFVLRDFDHDGVLEAILPCGNSLYVWRGDGSNYPGFPVNFASTYGPCATPAVGDLDGDGQLEIVLEGWEWLHVFHQDGSVAQGWPYRLSLSYEGFSYSSPVLVDADGDSYLEIVAAYHESGGGNWAGKVAVWRRDGTLMPGWPYVMADFGSWCYSTAAVADVDEDGALEFAMTSHNGRLYLFNFDGSQAPGFPIHTGYVNLEASCAIADLDDDSHLEICFGSNNPVYLGYERDGTVAPGFPTPMSAGMVVSGSCVADVDGDGRVNICAHEASGRVHLWDLPSPIRSDLLPWVRPHHDDHHTNLFSSVDPSALPDRFSSAFGSEGTLRLIPNPSHGDVRLLWTAGPGDLEWTIHDACGRRVGTGVLAASRSTGLHPGSAFSIDLDGLRGGPLPAGRYYVRAQGNGRILERSFILVR